MPPGAALELVDDVVGEIADQNVAHGDLLRLIAK